MSYIFDALRKSENERQRQAATSFVNAPLATARPRTPAWMWIVIGTLSLTLAALAVVWWRTGDIPLTSGDTPITAPRSTSTTQTTATPGPDAESTADSSTRLRPIAELATFDPSLPRYRLEVLAPSSRDPAESSAWINGRRYYPGERIGSGPVVIEVRADGVVLGLGAERFLLTTR